MAVKQGLKVILHQKETSNWYFSRRIGLTHSGYTLLTEQKIGKILGAHLLGYNADEVINIFALAIRQGLTLADLQETAWTHSHREI